MGDPFRNYDNWLQKGNPADEPDDEICEECGAIMEYEDDVDVDEETGKPYISGGSFTCPNCK